MAYKGPLEKNAVDYYKDNRGYHEIDEFGREVYRLYGTEAIIKEYRYQSKDETFRRVIIKDIRKDTLCSDVTAEVLNDGRLLYYKDNYKCIQKEYDEKGRLIRYSDAIGVQLEWKYNDKTNETECKVLKKGQWEDEYTYDKTVPLEWIFGD